MLKNARLTGYLLVLVLVLASLWYFKSISSAPQPSPDELRDVPPLGQIPSERQIHGSGPPPAPKPK